MKSIMIILDYTTSNEKTRRVRLPATETYQLLIQELHNLLPSSDISHENFQLVYLDTDNRENQICSELTYEGALTFAMEEYILKLQVVPPVKQAVAPAKRVQKYSYWQRELVQYDAYATKSSYTDHVLTCLKASPAPYCLVIKNLDPNLKYQAIRTQLSQFLKSEFDFELIMDPQNSKNRRVGLIQTRNFPCAESMVNLHGIEFFGKCLLVEPNCHKYKGVFKKY